MAIQYSGDSDVATGNAPWAEMNAMAAAIVTQTVSQLQESGV